MARIDVNKVELVWPGKYNEDGTLKEVPRVDLPFQVIETINQSRATREAKKKGTQQIKRNVPIEERNLNLLMSACISLKSYSHTSHVGCISLVCGLTTSLFIALFLSQ